MIISPIPDNLTTKISLKQNGEQLTTNEFNGIVSMLRHYTKHNDEIRITEEVTGEYGKYLFDLEDVAILDTGILINTETITAEPRVKLTNSLFKNSTYTLKLKVLHFTGANILDDITPSDYKVVDVLEIVLTPNTWVDIPVEDLFNGYIISFDAEILITHDKTEINGEWVNLIELTTNKTIVKRGDTLKVNATVTDNNGEPVENTVIEIWKWV